MTDTPGVLVTLSPLYREYAEADGKKLHARYGDSAKFGRRTLKGRIGSSGARRAVEQLHELDPGTLRKHGLDVVSTRNPNMDFVHVRPEHTGRLFFVTGPLDHQPVYLIAGSIDVTRAKARPMDRSLDPPAHVWRVAELDPAPGSDRQTHQIEPKPDDQLRLLDHREGRGHDRQVTSRG